MGRENRPVKKKRLSFIVAGVILIAVVLWGAGRQAGQAGPPETRMLRASVLEQKIPASAVLIKKETPVVAPRDGKITMAAESGQRVGAGTLLARVTGGRREVAVYSDRAGLLCRQVDGLEKVLQPGNTRVLDMDELDKIGMPAGEQTAVKPGIVNKGTPFCKIIDNLAPVQMFIRLEGESNTIVENLCQEEEVSLTWKGKKMTGKRLEERGSGSNRVLLLEVEDYPDQMLLHRVLDVKLIINEIRGYPVSREALLVQGTQASLCVMHENRVYKVPVRVLGSTGEKVVLHGMPGGEELSEYTRYVINPGQVKPGSEVEW